MQRITWWPGDYLRDTGDLSLTEHGAYRVLLDHYYSTDGRLKADQAALFRICRAMTEDEQAAVGKVVRLFFTVDAEGNLHNKKADEIIAENTAFLARAREDGKKGASQRWGKANPVGNPIGNPIAPPMQTPMAASTTTTTKIKTKPLGGEPPGFSDFWKAYPRCPRKEAKGKCLDLWLTKRFEEVAPEILAHVEAKVAEWTDPQFIPAPLVYLRNRRWEGAEVSLTGSQNPIYADMGLR